MNTILKKIYTTLSRICGFCIVFSIVFAQFSTAALAQTNVQLRVDGCNFDNVCEFQTENIVNCPNDCTPPPVQAGSSGIQGAGFAIYITDIRITPDVTSAIISWKTNRVTIGTLVWGTTKDYEDGTVSEINYTTNHNVKLENLRQNQKYYFRIDVQDTRKTVTSVDGEQFSTLEKPNYELPPNVSHLVAVPKKDSIQLLWVNPRDPDFDEVRITKSTKFFPQDPFEGKIVYEGKGNYVTDIDVDPDVTYYYSVFTRNTRGVYSSGAVVSTRIVAYVSPFLTSTSTPFTPPTSDPFALFPKATVVDPLLAKVSLIDFDFIQNSNKVSFSESSVRLQADVTKISIDYAKLPEILKTIAITIKDPTDSTRKFSFLLRVNKNKTAYEATIGSFDIPGVYSFEITVLDYKNQAIKNFQGSFIVSPLVPSTPQGNAKVDLVNNDVYIFIVPVLILIIILVAFALLVHLIYRRVRYRKKPSG